MKIIYKQNQNSFIFEKAGIRNCYLKHLCGERDIQSSTNRTHHHTFFELHFLQEGTQKYEFDNGRYTVSSANMIIIPPGIKHKLIKKDNKNSKLSITFYLNEGSCFTPFVKQWTKPFILKTTPEIKQNFLYILSEYKKRSLFSKEMCENRIFETIIEIMRLCGFKKLVNDTQSQSEDIRLSMAKQFIKDNIETNLKLTDVASYCYIGTKQLTRLFKQYENTTPSAYIQKERINRIIDLMGTSLTLGEISEKMNFSSEYHFNSFFKKIESQPPGEFRKMLK